MNLERQKELAFLHNQAAFCRSLGLTLTYDDCGNTLISLPYNPRLDHGLGGIHGGAIAALIDNAGWFAVAPHFSNWISTVEFQVRLLEHVEKKKLKAEGSIIRLGKKISVAEMKVYTEDGKLIALGSGTFALSSVPLDLNAVLPVLKSYEVFFQ